MINLIFSHIKDLGAEGADLFQLYIVLHYGINILNGIMVLVGICMLLILAFRIISSLNTSIDIVNRVHRQLGGCGDPYYEHEKRAVRSFIDKAIEKHKKGEL